MVHDSLIFDGVDQRQRAQALEMAADIAAKSGFQYFLTLNSDMVPRADFENGFSFDSFVVRRLTDRSPAERLLGIEFGADVRGGESAED